MADPLAAWWVHPIVVRRFTGSGIAGDVYADPETVQGFWRDGTVLVTNGQGEQQAASAMVALPASVDRVPVGSEVTAPDLFGGRTSKVIASAVADGGPMPTPNHQQIGVQ